MESHDANSCGYPPSQFFPGSAGYPPGQNTSGQKRPIGFVASDESQHAPAYTHAPKLAPTSSSSLTHIPTHMPIPSAMSTAGSSPYPQPPTGGSWRPGYPPPGYPPLPGFMPMLGYPPPGGPHPGGPLPGGPLTGASLQGGPRQSRSRTSLQATSPGYPVVGYPSQTVLPPRGGVSAAASSFSRGYPLPEESEPTSHESTYKTITQDLSGARSSKPPIYRDLNQSVSLSLPGKQGTIKPQQIFDSDRDADTLRKALKGWCTNHKMIISVVCARSSDQRMEVIQAYKQKFGRDLVADLKHALRGNFRSLIVGLLYPLHEYLARELRKAIAGLGTDEQCLIQILCTNSNTDIALIKNHYQQLYKKDLEKDIIGDTSGDFRRLLVSMCNACRKDGRPLDEARARHDAQKLLEAGVLRWGTDVSMFNCIIAGQSYEQLRLVFREYNAIANHTIMDAITKEMSGDTKRGFLAIIKCVYNTAFYFAEEIYNALKGMGTNNKVLKRIVVSRCEIDLELIKQEYLSKYKIPLATALQKETSGSYRKALLAIVNGN